MDRTGIKLLTWMGFILLILLSTVGSVCLAGSAGDDLPISAPIDNPLGDMEDPNTGESETDDKEFDDDNLYDENRCAAGVNGFQRRLSCEWDLIHDDPCHNLTYPPPKS